MDKPLIEVKNVNMYFKKGNMNIGAVVNVSLKIFSGKILSLVGESGCGKTTVGRIFLGRLKPTSGEVLFEGKNIWKMSKKEYKNFRPLVQVIHQDSYASLNPVRTIYQTLAAPLLFYNITKTREETEKKVEELLKMVGVIPPRYFMNKYPFHLSGGLRQRISLARATILEPKIIIADEPVSGVDASLRISVLDVMRKLNKELGIAFLYITHDLATARYFSRKGRIAVMYIGQIVETGEMNELIEEPRHPYLQALLSAIPVPDPKLAKKKRLLPLKSLDLPSAAYPPSGCRFHPRCPYAEQICSKEIPQLKSI
jgi:peptide/nickel transport system ATP-binding protein